MSAAPFGNDPRKTEGYVSFWNREDVRRPLVGFCLVGWFPMGEFMVCKDWGEEGYLTPEMINPADFLNDHIRIIREGEIMDDDAIRGASPTQAAVPWMPGIIGADVRILPGNVLGEEKHLSWEEALAVQLDEDNPWYRKYIEFAEALTTLAGGRFPVSHGPEVGPTDLHAILRGHTESILDLMVEPKKSHELLGKLGRIFLEVTENLWSRLPRFRGGCFDAPYLLWSPGPMIRIQEDAAVVYSPDLYREFVLPVDNMLASRFENNFLHLHSTSMFLLDGFLEIKKLNCVQVTQDATGPTVAEMIPYYQRIQQAGHPLLARGTFNPGEIRLIMNSLEPKGLFLNILVSDMNQVEEIRPLVGL